MAVTTQFGIPDTTGAHATLMPKLQYRFRVSFSGLGDQATDTTTQNVISSKNPEKIKREVAEEMAKCWYKLGEGKSPLFAVSARE